MNDENVTVESTKNSHSRLKRFMRIPQINLFSALMIAIVAALGIVAVAYLMYYENPNRKYDLARGGEEANQALGVEDDEADTTSKVTPDAVKLKIDYLDKELQALTSINGFNPGDLNDQNIQLLPADQPSS